MLRQVAQQSVLRHRGHKHSHMPKGSGSTPLPRRANEGNEYFGTAAATPYMVRNVPNSVAERVFGPSTPENTGCCSCLTRRKKKTKQNGGRRKRTVRRR
jgi:hypothetical protein